MDTFTRPIRRRQGQCGWMWLPTLLVLGLILMGQFPLAVAQPEGGLAAISPTGKDSWRIQKRNGMQTEGDYQKLWLADEGQMVRPPQTEPVTVTIPTVQLSDILPSTGFLFVRDMVTRTVLTNATGFFATPDVFVTAAHSVAPFIRHFNVHLEVVSNSRTVGGSHNYTVTAMYYESSWCQVLLQINRNHTHFLPLAKEAAEDGSMVRVLSNSPMGFGGIHLDGIVSRVFDVWNEGIQEQCLREFSIAQYNWYCEQERFLISTPTWPGASGSPVIAATGVIGTVETTGPHPGTAIAASTHGLQIPRSNRFVPMEHLMLHQALPGSSPTPPTSTYTWITKLWRWWIRLFAALTTFS